MSKTYERIVTTNSYKAEIYDNCKSYIDRRKDGRRWRITVEGTKWDGNTGGYHEYVVYLEPKDGRKVLRDYRRSAIREAHGDYDSVTPIDILRGAVGICPYY